MGAKIAVTVFNCVVGPVLILVGLFLAVQVADRDSPAGFLLVLVALVLPVFVISRVTWAAGYSAGWRDRGRRPRVDPPRPTE